MPAPLADRVGALTVQEAISESAMLFERAGVVLLTVGNGAHRYCSLLTLASTEKTLVC
jgi:hypothetical protein